MPTIAVECPVCHKHYNVDEKSVGKVASCACGNKFPITFETDLLIEEPPPPVRECPYCQQSVGSSATVCEVCGYDFVHQRAPRHKVKAYRKARGLKLSTIVASVFLLGVAGFIIYRFSTGELSFDVFARNSDILGMVGGLLPFLGVAMLFGLLPGIIAFRRKAKNRWAILSLSFFFGFTVVGWIAAFIWAHVDKTDT